jgi:hypothetical protein
MAPFSYSKEVADRACFTMSHRHNRVFRLLAMNGRVCEGILHNRCTGFMVQCCYIVLITKPLQYLPIHQVPTAPSTGQIDMIDRPAGGPGLLHNAAFCVVTDVQSMLYALATAPLTSAALYSLLSCLACSRSRNLRWYCKMRAPLAPMSPCTGTTLVQQKQACKVSHNTMHNRNCKHCCNKVTTAA